MTDAPDPRDRFNRIASLLIASAAVVAAFVAFFQTQASSQAAIAIRDAHAVAVEAMGLRVGGQTQVSYDWQAAFQTWAELDDQARIADAASDEPGAARYREIRDRVADLSDLLDPEYFDQATSRQPDLARYESELYITRATALAERYRHTSDLGRQWGDRANTHVVQLTVVGVALALLGLSSTLPGAGRFVFVGAGGAMTAVAIGWTLLTAFVPVEDVSTEAVDRYAAGVGLAYHGEYEAALLAFDAALLREPDYASAHYERGNSRYFLGRYDEAVADFEDARRTGRDDTNVGWNLGWTYYLMGRFDDAIRTDRHTLDIDPELIGVRLNLALALLAAGDRAGAQAEYADAMRRAAGIVAGSEGAPPASLWFVLEAGALDLQNLVDRIDERIFDWTQAPPATAIADPEAAREEAEGTIAALKSLTASLEATGQPPGPAPTARISPFEFARRVVDEEDGSVTYERTGTFHYYTKEVFVLFDHEGISPGRTVTYKVYTDGIEYPSLRQTETWTEERAASGSAEEPLGDAESRVFILPEAHYDVDVYVDHQLVQTGSFTILGATHPVAGEGEAVLFRDTFSDPTFASWYRYENDESSARHVEGDYQVRVTTTDRVVASHTGLVFGDAVVSVDAERVTGPSSMTVGVICRLQDDENYYALHASHEGSASIWKLVANTWEELAPWQTSDAVDTSETATNRLRAECVGDRLSLYVNDRLAVETRDATFTQGDTGVITQAFDESGVEVLYDDFLVERPASAGSVLHSDDFSRPDSGLPTYADADYSTEYSDGGYRIRVTRPQYSAWSTVGGSFSDVQVDVDASLIAGPAASEFGLICRYLDADRFYVMTVTADGFAKIAKRAAGEWVILADWAATDAVEQGAGAANHLRADCVGDELRLWVSDVLVAEATDADYATGDVGMMASAFEEGGADVRFDDLVVVVPGD